MLTLFPVYSTNLLNFNKCLESDSFNEISKLYRDFLFGSNGVDPIYPSAYINPNQYAFSSVSIESKICSLNLE
jgi:hypothetical protein